MLWSSHTALFPPKILFYIQMHFNSLCLLLAATLIWILSQILDSSKLKEFTDDNFKFDENGRRFSKRVENTVGKGEIARYEQFLLFQQCFQKTYTADT